MTKITSGGISTEENQGKVVLATAGTTRVELTGDGGIAVGGASDKIAFFGSAPVAAQGTTATSGTFAANAGTAAVSGSSWTGNAGAKAYTVHDVVSALKAYGILASD